MLGLLLAAGRGSRFDPHAHDSKLLAPVTGGSSFEVALRALKAAVTQCYCVLPPVESRLAGHANPRHVAQLFQLCVQNGVEVFFAPAARLGMGESLAWAAAQLSQRHPGQGPLLVHLADMPWVSSASMAAIGQACDAPDAIAAPIFQGQRGNPVAFGHAIWPRMLALHADQGARNWIVEAQQAGRLRLVNCEHDTVIHDIDSPTDLPSPHGT
jgi:molybdenum cofactor cytidylyltransferase